MPKPLKYSDEPVNTKALMLDKPAPPATAPAPAPAAPSTWEQIINLLSPAYQPVQKSGAPEKIAAAIAPHTGPKYIGEADQPGWIWEKQGDPNFGFKTEEEAARAALYRVLQKSNQAGKEYGGWIYQRPDGTYAFTPEAEGDIESLQLPAVEESMRPRIRASYHTHPKSRAHDSEHFSEEDRTGDTNDQRKLGKDAQFHGYMASPTGALKQYSPDILGKGEGAEKTLYESISESVRQNEKDRAAYEEALKQSGWK